jgi:amino acid transporter
MIHSGSIAALAVAFGMYLGRVVPLHAGGEKIISATIILTLTTINCLGIRGGKFVQNLIAVAKLGGLAGIILLLSIKGSLPIHLFERTSGARAFSPASLGIALVAVLWAYEGWHVISFVSGELRNPQRDLPRGLMYGTAIVMAIYLTANIGYYKVLSPAQIRGSDTVAALAVGTLLGPIAATSISILILVSLLGSLNGLILSGPRVYYAMARDAIFPQAFGQVSDRYRTPMLALIVQGIWAAVLAVSGSYQQLFTNVIFTAWIFYGLAVAAVLVLRRRQPQLARAFRVPGYPWVCLLFCAAALGLVLSAFRERPAGALVGIGLVACGIPVYFAIYARRPAVRR